MIISKLMHTSLHRLRLEEYLCAYEKHISGEVLDIGSKSRRYDSWFCKATRIFAVDLVPDEKTQVEFGNVEAGLDYKTASFDGILMIEVIQYLENPKKALGEVVRLLRPGAVAFITAPLMYREHGDRLHFTEQGFRELLPENCKVLAAEKMGNWFITPVDSIGMRLRKIKTAVLRNIALGLWLPMLLLAHSGLFWNQRDEFYSGMFFVVQKSRTN